MFRKRWFAAIYAVAYAVVRQKEKLISLNIGKSIAVLLYLIILELTLAFLCFPLYLSHDHKNLEALFNKKGTSYVMFRKRKRITLSTAGFVIAGLFLYVGMVFYGLSADPQKTFAATITWDGGGADNNWSTAENWSTDTVPTATDVVIFNGTTTTESIVDDGFGGTVVGFEVEPGYTGTIVFNRPLMVNGNMSIEDGTVDTGGDTLEVVGDFSLIGGTYRGSSVTTTFRDDFSISGGTFTPGSGPIVFGGTGNSGTDTGTQSITMDRLLTIPHLVVNHSGAGGNITFTYDSENEGYYIDVTNTVHLVDGSMMGNSGSARTVIRAYGDIDIETDFSNSFGFLTVTGTPRTITFAEGVKVPRLDIYGGSTINFSGTATTTVNTIAIQNGTVNANSASIEVTYSLGARSPSAVYNGGSGNEYVKGGILAYNGGIIRLGAGVVLAGATIHAYDSGTIDFSSADLLNHNAITGYGSPLFRLSTNATMTMPMTTASYEGAYFEVASGSTFNHSTGTLIFDGTNQYISASAGATFYNLTFTSTSADMFRFPDGVTTTVAGTLTLEGQSGELLFARSMTTGTQAYLDLSASTSLAYLRLRDVCNRGTTAAVTNTEDEGNNCGFSGLQDTTFPTTPGALTVGAITTNSATFTFGATSSDTNFSDYRITYAIGSTVSTSDTSFTSTSDSNLASSTFAGATTTSLSGLATSSQYSVMITAYDTYGNGATSSIVSFYTLATAPSDVVASNITANSFTISWNANGNGSTSTEYYVEDVGDTSRNSGWIASTSHAFTGLTANRSFTFQVKARNGDQIETDATVMSAAVATLEETTPSGSSGTLARPPARPPATPPPTETPASETSPEDNEEVAEEATDDAPDVPETEETAAPTVQNNPPPRKQAATRRLPATQAPAPPIQEAARTRTAAPTPPVRKTQPEEVPQEGRESTPPPSTSTLPEPTPVPEEMRPRNMFRQATSIIRTIFGGFFNYLLE